MLLHLLTHNNVRGLGLGVLLHFPFQFILYHDVRQMSSALVRGRTGVLCLCCYKKGALLRV
jgi:hypothetical protein